MKRTAFGVLARGLPPAVALLLASAQLAAQEASWAAGAEPTSAEASPPAGESFAQEFAQEEETPEPSTQPPAGGTAPALDLARALGEAALDLGIEARVLGPDQLEEEVQRGGAPAGTWLVSYRLDPIGELWRLEVIAVAPESQVRRTGVDVIDASRLEVRTMVLLREAVRLAPQAPPPAPAAPPPAPPPRSTGRAVLALNTALLGGAIGVSLHQAGASQDDRLLYPLAALGVGIGLGASMLVADEWDITTDDAWFLSAGMVWPAASGMLLAGSYDVRTEHRYLYGLSGTAVGLTLATVAVAQQRVYEGSPTLAHSGGAFGLGMGALAEGIVRGDLVQPPTRGMGYGSALGVLTAGIAATQVEISSSRVLLVDLAALLGGLTGGALATPLLLVDDVDDTRRRLWFGSVALGTVAGATLGLLATSDEPAPAASAAGTSAAPRLVTRWAPHAGVIAVSEEGTRRAPAFGGGVQGLW